MQEETKALETTPVRMLPDGRMNTKNAAVYCGVSEKTLAMWRCAGKGPKFMKIGRVFYYREDLDTWLKNGVVNSTAQARTLSNVYV